MAPLRQPAGGGFRLEPGLYGHFQRLDATARHLEQGAGGIQQQIANLEKHTPFAISGFDCDNGSEFLNYPLLEYFTCRKKPVAFTRSRPYHKNDNAHVEQKNWTHVRQLLGWDRLEIRNWWRASTISTERNGARFKTSSVPA